MRRTRKEERAQQRALNILCRQKPAGTDVAQHGAIVTAYSRGIPAAYDLLGNIVPQPINPEDDCC